MKAWLKSPNPNSSGPIGSYSSLGSGVDVGAVKEEGRDTAFTTNEDDGDEDFSDKKGDRDENNTDYDFYGSLWGQDNKKTDRSKLYLHIPRGIRAPVRNRNRGQTWAQDESSPGQDQDQDQDQDQSRGQGQGQGLGGRQGTIDKKYIKAFSRVRGTLVGKMAEEWGEIERGGMRFDLERKGMGRRAREKGRGRGRGWSRNGDGNGYTAGWGDEGDGEGVEEVDEIERALNI